MSIRSRLKSAKSYLRDFVNEFKFIADDMLTIKSRTFDIEKGVAETLDTLANVSAKLLDTGVRLSAIDNRTSDNHQAIVARIDLIHSQLDRIITSLSKPKINEEAETLRKELATRTQFYERLIDKLIDSRLSQPVVQSTPVMMDNHENDEVSPAMKAYLERKKRNGFAAIDAAAK